MRNFVSGKDNVTLVAPAGGVTSGYPLLIGDLLVNPVKSADEGSKFSAMTTGIVNADKPGSQSWNIGETIYFDAENGLFTTIAGPNKPVGVAAEDVAGGASDTKGRVLLNGVSLAGLGLEPLLEFSFFDGLPAGVTYTRNETVATQVNAAGKLIRSTANQPRTCYYPDGRERGSLCEETRQNKCTNHNINPPDATTNLTKSGDAASVLQRVDDSAALAAADLDVLCSSGQVFELDNSLGVTTATVTFGGTVGNVNPHSFSAFARMVEGTFGTLQLTGGTPGTVSFSNAAYERIKSEKITPSGTTVQMKINAAAGTKVRFILNQLEEGWHISSPIIIAGAAATRAADAPKYLNFDASGFDISKGTFVAEIEAIIPTGQKTFAGILYAASTGSFPTDGFYLQTNANSNAFNFYGKGNSVSNNVASISYPIAGRPHSVAGVYKNGVDLRAYAGPMVHTNIPITMTNSATGVITLHFASFGNSAQNLNGYLRRVLYFEEELTSQQLGYYMIGQYTGHSERAMIGGGQSNMEGYFAAASVLTNGGERAMIQALDSVWGTDTRNWVINGATGGTAIPAWQSGAPIAKWKDIATAYVQAGGVIDCILWDQFESDIGRTVQQFYDGWLAIFNDMRSHLAALGCNPDMPVIMVPPGRERSSSSASHNTNVSYARQARRNLAAAFSWIHESPEKFHQPLVDNLVHLTDAGYASQGPLVIRKALKVLGETITGGVDGPTITGVEITGDTWVATLSHDIGGTDFTPTSSIGGFQFYDDGVEIAHTSVVRTDATHITGTLNSTPSGVMELWYAWGSIYNSDGSTLVRDNSANALPLRSGKFTPVPV